MGNNDGYMAAFYEVAKMLDIGARAVSPAEVWASEMRPKLLAVFEAAKAAGASNGWRPIATAPLWPGHLLPINGLFDVWRDGVRFTDCFRTRDGVRVRIKWLGESQLLNPQPSHWMPQPGPPA